MYAGPNSLVIIRSFRPTRTSHLEPIIHRPEEYLPLSLRKALESFDVRTWKIWNFRVTLD